MAQLRVTSSARFTKAGNHIKITDFALFGPHNRFTDDTGPGPYNSWGNGSVMRVSPVGWVCDTVDRVLAEAECSAAVTHNHREGIKGAQTTALAVYLARIGYDKANIRQKIEQRFGYNLNRNLAEIRPGYRFDVSCQGSVPEAIVAFLEATDVEQAIRLAVSLGDDSDPKEGVKMRRYALTILLGTLLLVACKPTITSTPVASSPTKIPTVIPSPTQVPTSTPLPQGKTIIVTSASDSGPGTLRQALEDLQSYDTITFDTTAFPPDNPATIFVGSELPHIHASNITLDASEAGVILDGSQASGDWVAGLQIVSSEKNTIMGLQISNFSGPGIAISGDRNARHNVIGGDRHIGTGPFGQGNLLSNNAHGIDLSTSVTSDNVITGNLIGTDATGMAALGNQTGIWITEGAHDNTIGPDNVIAFNSGSGVVIENTDTQRNTITQNSIHDHNGKGIDLAGGGNAQLVAPIIVNFDLTAGAVTGVTCANCIVEIFSDSNDSGKIYEGQTTADNKGVFTFNKGNSFNGPHLTVTNTDLNGNTSQFSRPTSGVAGVLSLQQGNDLPITQFVPKQSRELVDNHIGLQFDSFGPSELYDLGIYNFGVKHARVAITGIEPELVDWGIPEFSIDPSHDNVFTRMADNGLTITYMLTFWDKETYPGGEGAPCARFKTEEEIEHYLEFVQFTVHHFKDRVQYFEIWNEPDIREYCPKWIETGDYINLVKRTVPVIRAEYPEAKIVVGGVSNTRFPNAYDYLFDLLESDIMPLVDVVSWHPMYGTSPAYDLYKDYYYGYPAMVQKIKDVATAHGFTGEYQADEIGWATPANAVSDQPWVYSPTVAAKYFGRGILMHRGMDVGVGLGNANDLVRNLCTVMAGVNPVSLPIQIQSEATNIVSYTFSLPDGGYLVGLWADGEAVENDPGVEASLTIPGLSARETIGIDILYGLKQELIFETGNGDLIIRNLLIKDYPTIIEFIDTTPIQ